MFKHILFKTTLCSVLVLGAAFAEVASASSSTLECTLAAGSESPWKKVELTLEDGSPSQLTILESTAQDTGLTGTLISENVQDKYLATWSNTAMAGEAHSTLWFNSSSGKLTEYFMGSDSGRWDWNCR